MSCTEFKDDLESLLSGRLGGERARRVRLHLACCPDCAAKLDAGDRLEALVGLDQAVEPSHDIEARFFARLASHRSQHRSVEARQMPSWNRVLVWALPTKLAAAGVLAAFLALGVYIGTFRRNPPVPAAAATEISIAENLPLLQDMAVIRNLDLLEDFDAIQNLQSGEAKPPGTQ